MQRHRRRAGLALLFSVWALSGCASTVEVAPATGPAVHVQAIEGTELRSVTLSERAAERLGIQTVPVEDGPSGTTEVPYAAVFYDADGATWVYTNPEAQVFVRAPIEVTDVKGDVALLSDGPPSGTRVVTVGVAELFGAETGVGDPR